MYRISSAGKRRKVKQSVTEKIVDGEPLWEDVPVDKTKLYPTLRDALDAVSVDVVWYSGTSPIIFGQSITEDFCVVIFKIKGS